MEDKVIQQSFTFKNSDRMTAQAKKTATNIQKRKWQVKEMEEDYEHERSTGLTGNKNGTKQKFGRIKNGRWQEYLQMKQLPEQR